MKTNCKIDTSLFAKLCKKRCYAELKQDEQGVPRLAVMNQTANFGFITRDVEILEELWKKKVEVENRFIFDALSKIIYESDSTRYENTDVLFTTGDGTLVRVYSTLSGAPSYTMVPDDQVFLFPSHTDVFTSGSVHPVLFQLDPVDVPFWEADVGVVCPVRFSLTSRAEACIKGLAKIYEK